MSDLADQILGSMNSKYGGAGATSVPVPQGDSAAILSHLNSQYSTQNQAAVPSTFDNLSQGFWTGVHDVTDKPAEWLSDQFDKAGINKLFGLQSGDQVRAQDRAYHQAYEQGAGNTISGNVGRVGGNLAFVIPAIESGGTLGGAAVRGLATRLSPEAGAATNAALRFLAGGAGEGATGLGGTAARVASKVANGALSGGAASALTSSGSDAPLSTQIEEGMLGGGVLGAALPLAGKVLSKGYGVVKNALSLGSEVSPSQLEKTAVNKLVTAMRADGMSEQDIATGLQQLGQHGLLADLGGPNVRAMAETVANTPGPGANLAQSALEGRMEGQAARIAGAVKQATGAQGDIYDQAKGLIAQRSAAAAPLYEKALAAQVQPDERLTQFLAHPLVQKGMAQGAKTAELEALADGKPFNPAAFSVADGKAVPMAALDAAKKGLDDTVEGYRDPVTGKLNLDQYGRAVNAVRAAFVNHLDNLNPDYAAARAAWSGPSQSLDAMNMGQKALTKAPEITADAVRNLSDNDKQFFMAGLTRSLLDKIDGTADGANAVRSVFRNSLMRDRIKAALGNDQAYQDFTQRMEAEAKFAQTRNEVLKGSQTARRLAAMQDSGMPGVVGNALTGNLGNAAANVASRVANYVSQPSQAMLAKQGEYLFGPMTQENLAAAIQRAKPGPVRQAVNNALSGAARNLPAALTLYGQSNYGR